MERTIDGILKCVPHFLRQLRRKWNRLQAVADHRGTVMDRLNSVVCKAMMNESRAEPLPVRHRGDARGNQGAPLHDRVHLPTYIPKAMMNLLQNWCPLVLYCGFLVKQCNWSGGHLVSAIDAHHVL